MSMIQKEISDFRVQAYHQGAFQTVSKADVLGKWAVFFFYPADFTFVCPTELEDLANKYADFQAAGCQVYAVSCDTHFVHKAWHDASERIQKIQQELPAHNYDISPEEQAFTQAAIDQREQLGYGRLAGRSGMGRKGG